MIEIKLENIIKIRNKHRAKLWLVPEHAEIIDYNNNAVILYAEFDKKGNYIRDIPLWYVMECD
jgi:hypothetical protein